MRTTLKRGIGRGANGNGHGALPPGALSPVTLYRQPPPPRRSFGAKVGRFFVWLGAIATVVVCGLVGGFYLWIHESAVALRPHTAAGKAAEARLDPPKSAAIALVIGYDHRAGDGNSPSRSDTMMLIRADPVTKTISLLSFPRDLVVPIYCPGKGGTTVGQGTGRINTAYAFCGPSGSLETVRHLTGLPINYLISVNFLGFIGVVNKLGGVWMDIDRRYYNKNVGTSATDYANIDLQPGYQHMTGKEALDFVRFRHTDSDLYRLARQQQFVSAMRQQVAHSFGPTSIPGIVNTITQHQYVEVARGGRELNLSDIYKYANFAYGLPHGHVFQVKIPDVLCGNECQASNSSIQGAVQQFLNPDVGAPDTATAVALGRKLKPRQRTIAPKQVTLTVLNGNGVAGSASNASYLLGQKGYVVLSPPGGQPANAPTWNYFHSKVYFDPARPGTGKSAAQQIARLVGSADVEPMPPNIKPLSNGALLRGGRRLDLPRPAHAGRRPADADPSAAERPPRPRGDALAPPWPAQASAVRAPVPDAARARLDARQRLRRDAVRIYPLAGQPTCASRSGPGSSATTGASRRRAGEPRRCSRTRTGPSTWAAARSTSTTAAATCTWSCSATGGATYWVVNTLLDSLSNETMLAIARGPAAAGPIVSAR